MQPQVIPGCHRRVPPARTPIDPAKDQDARGLLDKYTVQEALDEDYENVPKSRTTITRKKRTTKCKCGRWTEAQRARVNLKPTTGQHAVEGARERLPGRDPPSPPGEPAIPSTSGTSSKSGAAHQWGKRFLTQLTFFLRWKH